MITLLRGGRLLLPAGEAPSSGAATAVALAHGRILAVGDDAGVAAAAAAAARDSGGAPVDTVELAGRLVVPGFVDAHVHPVSGGLERLRCDLTGILDHADVLAAVAGYRDRLTARAVAGAPRRDDPWLLGGGWSMETFPGGTPRAADLDPITGDLPAFLPNRDHHSAWVNTAALRRAGLTAATPDPPGGRIERDPDGAPSGTLHEAAMDLVGDLVPAPDDAELDAALAEAQRHLLSLGVTGWQDAILGVYAGMVDATEAYLRARAAGTLVVRVAGALWWPRGLAREDVEPQAEALLARARRIAADGGGRVTAPTVKIMMDGVLESFTGAMHEPYLGTDTSGIAYLDRELLLDVVRACAVRGFGLHVHAIGDRAVTWALEALDAVPPGTPAPAAPHQLAHLQVVRDEDVALWARTGAVANCQALWACHEPQMDLLTIPFLGPERTARQYPFARLREAGVPLAMGSDWPVSSADPLAAVHVAVTRRAPGAALPPFLPEQALGVEEALRAYTAGSAAACGWRGLTGELRPGLAADLAVLSGDPLSGDPAEVGSTAVDLTYVGGERVHDAGR